MRRIPANIALLFCLWGAPAAIPAGVSSKVLVCGGNEVYLIEPASQPVRKLWVWKAAERPELPPEMRTKFETTSDCKPVEGGKVLITSSGDGVALVERPSGKVLFYANVPNAHSAEILPEGRVVVAASVAPDQPGDRLIVFELKESDRPVFQTPLPSAHGVVWDAASSSLWALGGQHLRSYALANWGTPHSRLQQLREFPLPDSDGHDLSPGNASLLLLTSAHHVWTFDRRREAFLLHGELGHEANVKSIGWHPGTKQTVWTQAERGGWWTHTLRFLQPKGTTEIYGERVYKARWLVD